MRFQFGMDSLMKVADIIAAPGEANSRTVVLLPAEFILIFGNRIVSEPLASLRFQISPSDHSRSLDPALHRQVFD
jgi:hypothetical protein